MPVLKAILTALLLAAFVNPFCPCHAEHPALDGVDVAAETGDDCVHPHDHDHEPAGGEEPHHCAHSDPATTETAQLSAEAPKWKAESPLFDLVSAARPSGNRETAGTFDPSPPPSAGDRSRTLALTGVFRL